MIRKDVPDATASGHANNRRHVRPWLSGGVVFAAVVGMVAFSALPAQSAPAARVTTLRTTSAQSLANSLAGNKLTAFGARFTGNPVQAGRYAGIDLGQPGFDRGVALSTGSLIAADPNSSRDVDFTTSALLGPNTSLTTTGDFGGPGSTDLTALYGSTNYDAATLRLSVIPKTKTISLRFLLGSEEYAGWQARGYADSLAIWVNGKNCALVPGTSTPVGTASINSTTNASLYHQNFTGTTPGSTFNTEFNGFTSSITCTAAVTPYRVTSVQVAIADTKDGQLDSTVLLAHHGLQGVGKVQKTRHHR